MLLFFASANAAIETIDFEELPDQTGEICNPACTYMPAEWATKGFTITGERPNSTYFAGGVAVPDSDALGGDPGNLSMVFAGTYQALDCYHPCGFAQQFSISQDSGASFDLLSLDVALVGAVPCDIYCGGIRDTLFVSGYLSGGGIISQSYSIGDNWETLTFGSGWTDLETLKIYTQAQGTLFDSYNMDNIVLTAVPIPAAVWLFGSALTGLGWLRRKQTT
ncbi:MAG: hypothetical protein ACR2QW_11095 [bacterium]